jgi:serpin B
LTEFPVAATKPDDFNIPGTPAFKVPMMNHLFAADYVENADFQLAQFPYKDNEVSMVVIVPKKSGNLAEVEKKLSAKALAQALALAAPRDLRVKLPKFKLTERVGLKRELTNLGMKLAFISGAGDFTAMEVKKTGVRGDSLYLSDVQHKAFVEVDEKGTEAAAATGVGGVRPVAPEPLPPLLFHANHPFLFLLRHNETGSILFMGRVVDPRGK